MRELEADAKGVRASGADFLEMHACLDEQAKPGFDLKGLLSAGAPALAAEELREAVVWLFEGRVASRTLGTGGKLPSDPGPGAEVRRRLLSGVHRPS
ncbi:hypothetical protein RCH21_003264 [Arthrobacter sp. PL16]|nr:hypothetical protein [Arthrobacter sp. PL16]